MIAGEAVAPASPAHVPVMRDEVVACLAPRAGDVCLDATLGLGGHAAALAPHLGAGVYVGLDRDPQALALAGERLQALALPVRWSLQHAAFAEAPQALASAGVRGADCILADLGISSLQLDSVERGFGWRFDDAPLDLRMDAGRGIPAAERLDGADLDEVARVLRDWGEVRQSRRIAAALLAARPRTMAECNAAIAPYERAEPRGSLRARVLQALRIWINDEIGQLDAFLAAVPAMACPGARLCILTYHSLEDRPVKKALQAWQRGCICPPVQPVCTCGRPPLGRRHLQAAPAAAEQAANPRSRSARLRGFIFAEAA